MVVSHRAILRKPGGRKDVVMLIIIVGLLQNCNAVGCKLASDYCLCCSATDMNQSEGTEFGWDTLLHILLAVVARISRVFFEKAEWLC